MGLENTQRAGWIVHPSPRQLSATGSPEMLTFSHRSSSRIRIKSSELHAHLAGDLAPDEDLVAARELARLGLR
jgi:hypothetical protein